MRFAPTHLFFVAADANTLILCEFFDVVNVNSFLLLNQTKLRTISNCFEQLSLEWRLAAVSSSAFAFLNTSNQVAVQKQ